MTMWRFDHEWLYYVVPTALILGIILSSGCATNQYKRFELDSTDFQKMAVALEKTPTGKMSTWESVQGMRVQLTPTNTAETQDQQACRDYVMEVVAGYGLLNAQGVACRHNDNTWRIIRHKVVSTRYDDGYGHGGYGYPGYYGPVFGPWFAPPLFAPFGPGGFAFFNVGGSFIVH